VKIFSTDAELLQKTGREVAEQLKQIKGVVDVFDGLVGRAPAEIRRRTRGSLRVLR
jgi:Cu/Ag efflux pump CusA